MTSILKADTIQDAAGNNIINENANTITIGASGDTVNIPAGTTFNVQGTAGTGFAAAGRVLIKEIDISDVAAVSFVNGTSGVVFDTTYDAYQLTWSNVKVIGDEKIRLEAMSSGSALTSGYVTGQSGSVSGTATGEGGVTAAFWESYGDMESGDICFGVANFYNVGVSSSKPSVYGQFWHQRSLGTIIAFQYSGVYNTEISTFNGLNFADSGGPNLASGKLKLYGIS